MRTEDIDRIRRVAEWMYLEGEVEAAGLSHVQTLCHRAGLAESDGCPAHRDDLIVAALDILFDRVDLL